ncbi:class I adenylate cyclase [Klebsiella pneumoniae subsp. pneumoniae]|nr:class I adenylate cyclase [Klebsiella pneumoniae subsp. pneumoniae]
MLTPQRMARSPAALSSLSAEEYFGASLWQLYKKYRLPYKAVLKNAAAGSLTPGNAPITAC